MPFPYQNFMLKNVNIKSIHRKVTYPQNISLNSANRILREKIYIFLLSQDVGMISKTVQRK